MHSSKLSQKSYKKSFSKSNTLKNSTSFSNIVKTCKKYTKFNYCQDKSSSGHQGAILSTGKNTCLKKVSKINNEIKFYNEYNLLKQKNISVLNKFIPKYDGICELNNNNYFIMKNLKGTFEQPLAIDIKIGYKTISKKILKQKKLKYFNTKKKKIKHFVLDSIITPSGKYGFRIEGVSLPNNIKFSKFNIMNSKFEKIFDYYFQNDKNNIALKSFIENLKFLYNDIKSADFNRFYFVGASILFIYDGFNSLINPVLKLIDFENSLILHDTEKINNNIKHAIKWRNAIKSLINILENYLDKKK